MLIDEKHPFKRVENYFTDSLLYQDPLEAVEDPSPKDSDSGNKDDTKPHPSTRKQGANFQERRPYLSC